MKKFVLALAALAAFPLAAAADVTKEDIRKLVGAGVSDEVIVTFIRSNGPVQKMSSDDLIELKQSGASERVLGALIETPKPAPARPQTTVREVPETTTYVYTSPAYTPSYYGAYYYGYPPYAGYSYSYPYPRYSYAPSYYHRPYYGGYVGLGYRSGGSYGSRAGISVGVGFGW